MVSIKHNIYSIGGIQYSAEERSADDFYYHYLATGEALVANTVDNAGLQAYDISSFNPVYKKGRVITEAQFQTLAQRPPLMLHAANFYDIDFKGLSENDFTKTIGQKIPRSKAKKEGLSKTLRITAIYENAALAAIYNFVGHNANNILPQPDARDGVYSVDQCQVVQHFTNNNDGTYTAGDIKIVTPIFAHKDRGPEAAWKREYFRESLGALEDWIKDEGPKISKQILSLTEKDTELNKKKEFFKNVRDLSNEEKAELEKIQEDLRALRNIYLEKFWDIKKMKNPKEFGDTRFIQHLVSEEHPGGFILVGIMLDNEAGTHARSTAAGNEELGKKLDMPIVEVFLKKPFYHMDTAGIPGTEGHFFTNRECFADEESWKRMKKAYGNKLIEIPFDDLENNFFGNGTCYGNNVFTSDRISDKAKKTLTDLGYNVYLTSIEAFIASGGGHRCNTQVELQAYVKGGIKFKGGFNDKGEYDPNIERPKKGKVFKLDIDYTKKIDGIKEKSPFKLYGQVEQPDGTYIENKKPFSYISGAGVSYTNIKKYKIADEKLKTPNSFIKHIKIASELTLSLNAKSKWIDIAVGNKASSQDLVSLIKNKVSKDSAIGFAARDFIENSFIPALEKKLNGRDFITKTSFNELAENLMGKKSSVFSHKKHKNSTYKLMLSNEKASVNNLLNNIFSEKINQKPSLAK